jgi:hypothetical protein
MKGKQIPELALKTLNKLIEYSAPAPSQRLQGMFPTDNAPSDTIEWEVRYGSSEMLPAVARGSRGPSFGVDGVARNSARAAYFAADAWMGEEFLNNLREPGTVQSKQAGQKQISQMQTRLINSAYRRREFMLAKMLFDGTYTYNTFATSKAPEFISLDWGIPSTHKVTKGSTARWYGSSAEVADRDVFADVFTMKTQLEDSLEMDTSGVQLWLNGRLLQSLVKDSGIRDLVQNSNVSEADIVARPAESVAHLLGVGSIITYNDSYTVSELLAANYTGGTSITVMNATDFEVGGEVYMQTTVDRTAGPRATITAVDKTTGVLTIDAELTSVTGYAGKDKLAMRKFFLAPNKIVGVVPTVDNMPIAEVLQAPHGNAGTYGMRMRTKEEEYPDGQRLIISDLHLPVLYFPAAVYQLTVGL